ncbi:transmembrane protein 45A [Cinnamomum micranthum f. kanehirae]|uniref:Transmembrane protein 45A n=1 Tax=Cinnamomum micranthum f. kanehirae TaxID=337451 RepID=A0A3S3N4T6_9MAGN|nr:transmembrane protein 45A [Cinnamomum micranthum f. kanehirae]
MGTLVGHVVPGSGFLLIGLWHLFNHIKLHSLNPNSYTAYAWFPTSILRYLELFLIMGGSTMSIAMELFIGPERHQPLDPDWTIPSNHLHNFEHSLISFSFFVYAAFALLFDYLKLKAREELTQLLGAIAFGQQLLLFHLHSADHLGVEGQYHLLLQVVVLVSLATTLLTIAFSRSFLISFVRSLSILFQGVWLIVMGFVLWTPGLVPKGCHMNSEDDHMVVRCTGDQALHRAKSLVNIQFSWFLVCITIFAMVLYLVLLRRYENKVAEYRSLDKEEEEDDGDGDGDDVESQIKKLEESQSFIHMGKGLAPIDMER